MSGVKRRRGKETAVMKEYLERSQDDLRRALVYLEHHGKGIVSLTMIAEVHAAYVHVGQQLDAVIDERRALGKRD